MTFRLPHALSSALLAVVALPLTLPDPIAADRWVPLGPVTEQGAPLVEIDAAGPPDLYALHDLGVLRSPDGGATWQLGAEGLRGDLRLVDLMADPHRPGSLYLAVLSEGVYRSFDAGAHWHPAGNRGLPEFPGPSDLEAHPTRPSTLYLATATRGVFVTEDRGDSWRATGVVPDGGNAISNLAIDPDHPESLYLAGFHETIGTAHPVAFKSDDAGATWQSLDVSSAFVRTVVPTDVVVAPGGPGAVYIASSGGGIIRSTDGGTTWTRADAGLPMNEEFESIVVEALAAHPADPDVLYASTNGGAETSEAVFRTADGGDTWEPFGEWPEGAQAARDLEIHPDDPFVVLAAPGPHVSPAQADGAWLPRRPALPSNTRFVTPHPDDPETLYVDAGTATPDLRWTSDSGASWEPFGATLPPEGRFQPGGLVVDPEDPGTLYLFGKSVFKTEDGGLTWVERTEGLEGGVVEIEISPVDPTVLYASSTSVLYRSVDGAESWTQVFDGDGGAVGSLVFHPEDPQVLFAVTNPRSSSDPGSRVCRSLDGGGSWACAPTGVEDGRIGTLRVDPADPDRFYLVRRNFDETEILRSVDSGESWQSASQGLPEVPIHDLALDPAGRPPGSPSVVWAATDGHGVYRSGDGGDSWLPLTQGMGPVGVRDLSLGPGGLYAASRAGVFRLDRTASAGDPLPPDELDWIEDPALPGFRVKVRIDQGGGARIPGTKESACIPETVCFSGAVPGRSEVFLRIVGPKPNGWLWPNLVKFSTSRIEVWIQQLSTGELRYYELQGASPGFDELPGLFDRFGFLPD